MPTSTCKIYVHASALDDYKAPDIWKDFLNIEAYSFETGIAAVEAENVFDGVYRVFNLNVSRKADL
ncbi:MAG: hypothetical protein LIO90_09860 [Bacteroidales bacterium]|nr:hypothetical protein [Bacteroidales bacterium]